MDEVELLNNYNLAIEKYVHENGGYHAKDKQPWTIVKGRTEISSWSHNSSKPSNSLLMQYSVSDLIKFQRGQSIARKTRACPYIMKYNNDMRDKMIPLSGDTIYNTDSGMIEIYDGVRWVGQQGSVEIREVVRIERAPEPEVPPGPVIVHNQDEDTEFISTLELSPMSDMIECKDVDMGTVYRVESSGYFEGDQGNIVIFGFFANGIPIPQEYQLAIPESGVATWKLELKIIIKGRETIYYDGVITYTDDDILVSKLILSVDNDTVNVMGGMTCNFKCYWDASRPGNVSVVKTMRMTKE